jgi:predicted nucleic acid-binding protein
LILLDTGVISAVLRRRRRGEREERLAKRVERLLHSEELIALPGIVFQEILSGIAEPAQFERILRGIRSSFPVIAATEEDHLEAARLSNAAAARGIASSTPDTLIAAQAFRLRAVLFTIDPDFEMLRRVTEFTILK